MDFPLNLLLDFLFTLATFAAFCIAVSGVKAIIYSVRKYFKRFFPEKRHTPAAKKTKRKTAAIRSIEIDPEEVDRIYVKKIS